MSNEKLILYVCNLLWECVTDGNNPTDEEWQTVRDELQERGLDPDEIFPY